MKKIAIVDLGSGNLHSVKKAVEKVIVDSDLSHTVEVVSNPSDLKHADCIMLPGVGAFGDVMNGLNSIKGLRSELEKQILENDKPFLGICVGMQILAKYGYEYGTVEGLGWFDAEVVKLKQENEIKIPHMGWNELIVNQPDNILVRGIKEREEFYFVHSYHMLIDKEYIVAKTSYGQDITSIISRKNIFATQFHPEKSSRAGLLVLKNFFTQIL